MFAGGVILAVIIALLRGGKLQGLLHLPFHYQALVLAPFVARFGLFLADVYGLQLESAIVLVTQTVAYVLLLVGLWLNRSVRGVPTIGLGVLLNALAVVANGGQMPVLGSAAFATGQGAAFERMAAAGSYLHQPLTEATRLAFLGDIFATPHWLPSRTVFSAGDVLILLGVMALVQFLMMRPVRTRVPYYS